MNPWSETTSTLVEAASSPASTPASSRSLLRSASRAAGEPTPTWCWLWSGSVSQLITTAGASSGSTYSRSTRCVQLTAASKRAPPGGFTGAGPKRARIASLTAAG